MATRVTLHLDHTAIEKWLQTVPRGAVSALAEQVGEHARKANDSELQVYVEHYTTDRAASHVSVPAFLQARDGVLTAGLAAAGLQLSAKRSLK